VRFAGHRRCALRKVHGRHFAGQSAGRSPIAHSFGGSPSAVFWYLQLPQTVQFQLLLTFVMLPGWTDRNDTRSGEITVWRYAGWLSNQVAAGIARLHIGLQQIISRNRRTSFFKRYRPDPDMRTVDCVEVLVLRRRRPVPPGVNVAAGHTVRS
jgi:hypothetical protein